MSRIFGSLLLLDHTFLTQCSTISYLQSKQSDFYQLFNSEFESKISISHKIYKKFEVENLKKNHFRYFLVLLRSYIYMNIFLYENMYNANHDHKFLENLGRYKNSVFRLVFRLKKSIRITQTSINEPFFLPCNVITKISTNQRKTSAQRIISFLWKSSLLKMVES